jgi:glyoxylase-like metal-dependent hydrolase (beta-lactamase superfamily II)
MKREMILGLVLSAATVMGCGTGSKRIQAAFASSEDDGIFHCKVGQFDIFMLVESQREGNTGILVGADETLLQRYIPASGFMHSTNAFLIKTPTRNILVDTAFGGILEKVKKLGVELDKVDTVLLTHLHGDHFSGLVKDGAATLPNAKVYLSAKEYTHFTKTQVNDGAVAVLSLYGNNVIMFEPADLGSTLNEIIPGISPIASYGHTPGHTAYLVENSGGKLLIAGDFLHIALVQFPVPEISASYDMNKEEAAVARRQIMHYAAKNNIPIGGMHMMYPAVGNVEIDGDGFKFIASK